MSLNPAVARFYALAVAEEVASEMRHDAVNGFGGLAAMAYQLWRRVTTAHPPLAEDGAIVSVYKGFSTHVTTAADRLDVRYLPETAAAPTPVDVERAVRASTSASVSAAASLPLLPMEAIELDAMLFGLLDAIDSTEGHPHVQLDVGADEVISITLSPLARGAIDVHPLGVRVAQRLAARWRGDLAVVASEEGRVSARVRLPTHPPGAVSATNAPR